EHLPAVPNDDQGLPDAVLSVIGTLAAFDHWRQRVTLLDNVIVPPEATEDELDALYDEAARRIDDLAAAGARPRQEPVVEPPDADEPPAHVDRVVSAQTYARAVEVAKEHIVAGDIFQVVLAQRF